VLMAAVCANRKIISARASISASLAGVML
jgi:hypothetical protein